MLIAIKFGNYPSIVCVKKTNNRDANNMNYSDVGRRKTQLT